jgi:hypothetical protein
MGTCVSTKAKKSQPLPFVKEGKGIEQAVIIIEENFKIVDYTQVLIGLKEIKDPKALNSYFLKYRPSDIRCVKAKTETKSEHSHIVMAFIKTNDPQDEIGIITDYSRYGFAFTIGEMKLLKEICNLKGSVLELLHLPKAENQNNLSIGDVIEWAYLHKDEEYKNPKHTPELNMGKRIFRYISEKLSEDFTSTKSRV